MNFVFIYKNIRKIYFLFFILKAYYDGNLLALLEPCTCDYNVIQNNFTIKDVKI